MRTLRAMRQAAPRRPQRVNLGAQSQRYCDTRRGDPSTVSKNYTTCSTVCCRAGDSGDTADSEESSDSEKDSNAAEAAALLQQHLADLSLYEAKNPDHIGAEYGQGFVQFKSRGEVTRLGVDELNERMEVKGPLRLRHSMCPDEGYGVVMCWDGVVCDTQALRKQAWRNVAQRKDLHFPSLDRPQMFTLSPERAAIDVLMWTRNVQEARSIAFEVATEYAKLFRAQDTPRTGLMEWLQALNTSRVPVALVSNLDRFSLKAALERMGLDRAFQVSVTAEDGMETRSQQLLSAAIKLGRPPKQCAAFVSDIEGITAAHNTSLRAVAVIGEHPQYRLATADLTCGALGELTVYNLRRLFSDAGQQLMDRRKGHDSEKVWQRPSRIATF